MTPWELPVAGLFLTMLALACTGGGGRPEIPNDPPVDAHAQRRAAMVTDQIEARGIADACVLDALRQVPRHKFVPAEWQDRAYQDRPLPIGERQTISQPYIVALMTELIEPHPEMKVLEIGTGSGYQAAVLSVCVQDVFTIEILPDLGQRAHALLAELGYANIHPRIGDGYDGWPDEAPFDAILVTAAPPRIPQPLMDQLAVGGRMIIPVGEGSQDLTVVTRTEDGFEQHRASPVRFVPMTGKAQDER